MFFWIIAKRSSFIHGNDAEWAFPRKWLTVSNYIFSTLTWSSSFNEVFKETQEIERKRSNSSLHLRIIFLDEGDQSSARCLFINFALDCLEMWSSNFMTHLNYGLSLKNNRKLNISTFISQRYYVHVKSFVNCIISKIMAQRYIT